MSENWIKGAIKKPGSLRKTLGVSKKTGNIPFKKLKSASMSKGTTGKRAKLALTLRGMHK